MNTLYANEYGQSAMLRFFRNAEPQSMHYDEFRFYAQALAAGFMERKVSCILTILPNGPDWDIIDAACYWSGSVHVSLPPLAEADLMRIVISDNKPQLILIGYEFVYRIVGKIVTSAAIKSEMFLIHSTHGLNSLYQSSFFLTKSFRLPTLPGESTQTIIYTSGSAGVSKGVILSRNNWLSAINVFSKARFFQDCNKALSLLPVSFSGERKLNYSYKANGITICYPSPLQNELESLLFYKPDVMAVAPFLLRKIQNQVLETGIFPSFLKAIICGGASLAPSTSAFFEEKGIIIYEVYGLTETASLISFNDYGTKKTGTVGQVAKEVNIRIEADGELLCKAPNNTTGYKNNEPATTELLTQDGYLRTGDIVSLDSEGYLTICGRKKNILKGPHGLYILPELIEHKLMECNEVNSAIVCCDEEQKLSALLWLNNVDESKKQEAAAWVIKCNKNLQAAEKIERIYIFPFRDSIPLTISYKMKREELLKRLKESERLDIKE
ncbi:MAG: AMP-binding protein [Chitinophagales bacterium]